MLSANASTTRIRRSPVRGSVMLEMVLALPFFFFVLSLLIFLGRGGMRLQQSHIVDRYEAWRDAEFAPGPHGTFEGGADQLNSAFFRGKGQSIDYYIEDFYPQDVVQALAAGVGSRSDDANNLVNEVLPTLDQGRHVVLVTHFKEENKVWAQLNQPITHGYVRIGTEWKFANGWEQMLTDGKVKPTEPGTHVDAAVNKVFVKGLDDILAQISKNSSSPKLAAAMRGLYDDVPAYFGPDFPKPLPR